MEVSTVEEVTVLHVDDQQDLVDVTATYLEQEMPSFTVETATDAQSALGRVGTTQPDCIVSDYEMPGTNGLEFLQALRQNHPDLPFILFTGKGSEEIASRAISAGVDDYIQKETGTEQYTVLANRIRNLVRTSRAEDAVRQSEERYHTLIDTAPVPIVLFDQKRELLYANDAAADFLEATTSGELVGMTMTDFVHPDDIELVSERFASVMDGAPVGEQRLRIQTVEGTTKEGFVATAPGVYQGEPVAQAVLRQRPPS